MKKVFALILVLVLCSQSYAQSTVNTTISGAMTGLCYNNTYNSYNSNGSERIGQCQSDGTSTANGNLHNYVLVVFDLGQQFGGKLNTIDSNNSIVTVQLDGSHGYTGAYWQAGFITTDVSNSSAQNQINAIINMAGYSSASDVPTTQPPTITLQITYQKIVENKIIIGVRRDNAGLQYLSSCTATINGTVLRPATLNVTYNQGAGNIVAYIGSTYQEPSAPAHPNGYETDQVHIAPLSPSITNYQLVYNETQAPSNKSYWQKYNSNGTLLQDHTLTPASNSFSLAFAENNWTYEAQMRKLCNVTFVKPDGNSYQSVIEGNEASTVTAPSSYSSNDVTFTFQGWSKGGAIETAPFIITDHVTYNAVYKAKPSYAPLSPQRATDCYVGDPIRITWTDHTDAHVNTYEIRRVVKHNGVNGPVEVLATVGRGVQSYTDQLYQRASSYVDLIQYDIRGYYVPTAENIIGEFTDANYIQILGETLVKEISKNQERMEISKEIPETYSVDNYPNPFNPTTVIKYQIPEAGFVTLKVYDILGKEVAALVNEAKEAGYFNATFNAKDLPSGIYIYSIQANGFNQSKKMLLVK